MLLLLATLPFSSYIRVGVKSFFALISSLVYVPHYGPGSRSPTQFSRRAVLAVYSLFSDPCCFWSNRFDLRLSSEVNFRKPSLSTPPLLVCSLGRRYFIFGLRTGPSCRTSSPSLDPWLTAAVAPPLRPDEVGPLRLALSKGGLSHAPHNHPRPRLSPTTDSPFLFP